MKYIITLLFIMILMLQLQANEDYKQGELLVMLSGGSFEKVQNRIVPDIEKNYSDIGLRARSVLSRRLNIWLFEYDHAKIKDEQIINFVKADKYVKIAQFNHYVEERESIPDDEYFPNQWPLHNTGQSGVVDADIDAAEAWDVCTGGYTCQGDEIIIGIQDSGFDLDNTDLNFWKNTAEIPGDEIDNDNNGYEDDYNGWSSVYGSGSIPYSAHGTHVSGIAGAIGDNSIGVSGVCQNAKIMPVHGSSTVESVVIEGYGYFYEMRSRYNETGGEEGAFVVVTNASFGRDGANPDDYPLWCAIYDSLGSAGIISVGATCNRPWNIESTGDMPTACNSEYLISVTNSTSSDAKYINAGYGAISIDLAAPGTSVYSTISQDYYGNKTGTSMAAPHVSGTIALMFSAASDSLMTYYKNNLSEGSRLFRQILLDNVDELPSLDGLCVTGGRLNANNAVRAISQMGPPHVTTSAERGWNQISFPINSGNNSFSEIFPDSTIVLSYHTLSGEYIPAETIDPSKAYWVRLPADYVANVNGELVTEYTFVVEQGWNFMATPLTWQSIDLSPYTEIETVFEYKNGFINRDNKILLPGKTYWIKAGMHQEIPLATD